MDDNLRLRKAVDAAKIKEGFRVLDLGSGDNIILNYIDKKIYYVSVDFGDARKRYNPLTNKKNYINHNLEKGLPKRIKKQKFDVIFLLEFLEHIENFRSLLFECKDCLKDNGKIILTTPSNHRFILGEDETHIHCFRKSNLRNLAKMLNMKIKTEGVYIRIPLLELKIPSTNTVYNEVWLVVLEK